MLSDRYRTECITFRDLLSHRTCIADLMIIPIGLGATNKSHALHEQRYIPESCEFRSIQFSYNQPMVQVAAEALASIIGEGRSFEELLLHLLRGTLGMVYTRIIQEDDDYTQVPNMSQPYYTDENGTLHPMNPGLLTRRRRPRGGGRAHLRQGHDELDQAYAQQRARQRECGSDRQTGSLRLDRTHLDPFQVRRIPLADCPGGSASGDLSYELGWLMSMFDGYQRLTHPGSNVPYETLIDVFPALNLGIFTLVSGGAGHHYELHALVAGMVLGGYDARGLCRRRGESLLRA